jgi:glycerophosphoryl diester phosphodiesterase
MAPHRFGSRATAALIVVLILATSACRGRATAPEPPPELIAHAGGIGNHRVYTNSREALEHSVGVGHTAIEIDLSWTTDDRLVLVHDWDREFSRLFDRPPGPVSQAQFQSLRSPWGISQLVLDDLEDVLDRHPGVRLVTDIKDRNTEGLKRIALRFPEHRDRFVPQIYHPDELGQVRALGFETVIFTLYRTDLPDQEIVSFVESEDLWAVTMPLARAMSTDLAARIAASGTAVFAHTVNDRLTMESLRLVGVSGVYTDWLSPSDALIEPDAIPWDREVDQVEKLDQAFVSFVPWAMDHLQLVLALTNSGDRSESVRVAACDAAGQTLAAIEVELAAGETQPIDLREFAGFGQGQGWLRIDGGSAIEPQLQRQYRDLAPQLVPVDRRSYRRMSTRGSGHGLSGLLLAVVNPTGSSQTYELQRRIGDEIVDAEIKEVEPGRQLIRIYRSSTDEPIEITVTGGPMVADTLRWDAMIRSLW